MSKFLKQRSALFYRKKYRIEKLASIRTNSSMQKNIVFAIIHEDQHETTKLFENINIKGSDANFFLKSTNPQILHQRTERMKKLL